MTDVSYTVFILHLIIVLNWGLQSKCCQNDSGPRITLSIKMQARRGLQGQWGLFSRLSYARRGSMFQPKPTAAHRGHSLLVLLSRFCWPAKSDGIPSPQKAVALKQLLLFPLFFCCPTSQTTECLFSETDCNRKTVDSNGSDSFQARNVIWCQWWSVSADQWSRTWWSQIHIALKKIPWIPPKCSMDKNTSGLAPPTQSSPPPLPTAFVFSHSCSNSIPPGMWCTFLGIL